MPDRIEKNLGLREMITDLRIKLRFEENHFRRAQIYLQLTRYYRLLVRMKNARLELRRAYDEIGLRWPKNSYLSVVRLLVYRPSLASQLAPLHPDFLKASHSVQMQFLAELYEELGLSAYYLRHFALLIQATLLSEKPCLSAGASQALLNWYGGTACVMALRKRHRRAGELIAKSLKTAEQIGTPTALAKAEIWAALCADYMQDPVQSAKIFTDCLKTYGARMEASDLRLASVTLGVNLYWRGHARQSLEAIACLANINKIFSPAPDHWDNDSASWYAIPGNAMMGDFALQKKISRMFTSIISSDNDEKWMLTQFIGNLLIAHYWSQSTNDEDVDDLIKRFEILHMRPQNTHMEALYYWTARAYVCWSKLRRSKADISDLRNILRKLRRLPSHPTAKSHTLVLSAALALEERKRDEFVKIAALAEQAAQSCKNDWALFELSRLRASYFKTFDSTQALSYKNQARGIALEQGWRVDDEL